MPSVVGTLPGTRFGRPFSSKPLGPVHLDERLARAGTGRSCDRARRRSRCGSPTASPCAAGPATRCRPAPAPASRRSRTRRAARTGSATSACRCRRRARRPNRCRGCRPARVSPFQSGPGLPMPQYVRFRFGIVRAGHPDRAAAGLPRIAAPRFRCPARPVRESC